MSTTKNDNNLVKEANLLLNNLENISKKHHPCALSNPKQNMARKRRHGGAHAHQRINPNSYPPPTIPTQYLPICNTPTTTQAETLLAFQCHFDKEPFMRPGIPLIFDTGASITISNCKHDFVGPISPVQNATIQGIASGVEIKGIGTVQYTVLNANHNPQVLTIPGTPFAPACLSRLICPRQLLDTTNTPNAEFPIRADGILLHIRGYMILVPYDGTTGLPTITTTNKPSPASPSSRAYSSQVTGTKLFGCTTDYPSNLTPTQQTKMKWHGRLNHTNIDTITQWMHNGTLSIPQSTINAPNPIYLACQVGKARQQAHKQMQWPIDMKHSFPDAGVSADQLEAGYPGLLPTTKGSPTNDFC